jgi:hypothetical protein
MAEQESPQGQGGKMKEKITKQEDWYELLLYYAAKVKRGAYGSKNDFDEEDFLDDIRDDFLGGT